MQHWVDLQNTILDPPLLRAHPKTYLDEWLQISREKIKIQQSGKNAPEQIGLPISVSALHTRAHVFLPPYSTNFPPRDWSILQSIANKYFFYHFQCSLKIMGYVVLAAQHWRDRVQLKKLKVNKEYTHGKRNLNCLCMRFLQFS